MRLERPEIVDPELRADLLDLWVEAWTAAMPSLDFGSRRAWFSNHLDALVHEGAILVLCRLAAGAPPAGFMTVHPGSGQLDQLVVRLPLQGRGVARTLLDEAKRLSPAKLRLSVNADNPRAAALYAQAGFVRDGEAVNPRSGLPVWTMRWTPAASSSTAIGADRSASIDLNS